VRGPIEEHNRVLEATYAVEPPKLSSFQMLVILIPVAWLAIVAFVTILCRCAARADTLMTAVSTELAAPAVGHRTPAVFEEAVSQRWAAPSGV
jgi:hypothetical protein